MGSDTGSSRERLVSAHKAVRRMEMRGAPGGALPKRGCGGGAAGAEGSPLKAAPAVGRGGRVQKRMGGGGRVGCYNCQGGHQSWVSVGSPCVRTRPGAGRAAQHGGSGAGRGAAWRPAG